MHPKVKICGMKNAETIKTAIDHKVDFLGFVFYPDSPRNLTPKQATILTKDIPNHILHGTLIFTRKMEMKKKKLLQILKN